jgi:cytochrome c oxidase accessory protein FixG
MSEIAEVQDALSRAEQKASPLYAGRVRVHPKSVSGTFRRVKWTVLAVLLALYYVAPWIRFDRGPGAPGQAILADFETRRIYFFWIEIWPQEVYYLTGLLMLAAFGLFLATALFGRLWCGFACPQTVWTDLFMWVERLIEGDRAQRIRLDAAPWSADKLRKRALKHAAWLVIAAATGGAWIMYFNDAPTVVRELVTGQAGFSVYFFFGLFTFTTYLLAGHAREQVCTYMCPWPRIQGALVDQDTLAVSYETWRGEPRGKYRRGESFAGRGDCIDCRQCVAVCPMGIDIRDGFQLECIGCGLCIDACDDVMAKIGRPLKLISYDSERNLERRARREAPLFRLVRPRTVLYAGVLGVVASVMLAVLALRETTDVNVLPERNPLFVQLADGGIRNGYTFKILNKERQPRTYELSVEGLAGARLLRAGDQAERGTLLLDAPPDGVGTHRIYLKVPREAVAGEVQEVGFVLVDAVTGQTRRVASTFRGPRR